MVKISKKSETEKLKSEIERLKKELKKRKEYGLVWEDKPEDVVEQCKTELPVLKEVKNKAIAKDKNGPVNILIEGDNYHALSVLNYTHKGKIDVIYIDPPYNTGASDWKYNNNYVDIGDQWRHSKWILMMEHRLKLAKKLLSPTGFLICSIDENEVHNIRHLLDDLFGESNKVGMVTVLHNPKGRNLSKFFSENSEFMLVYARNKALAQFNDVAIDEAKQISFGLADEGGKYRLEPFMRARSVWSRRNRPKNWYPIYVSKDLKKLTLEKKKGYHEVFPKTKDGREWAWKNIASSFRALNKDDFFVAKKEEGRVVVYHKYREKQVFKNVWIEKKYQSEFHGTNLLKDILRKNLFEYPKSLYLIADILRITAKDNSVVLDYFAGSGTTGHAVLHLNREYGGNRRFILCTNNENNIATDVCYPRIAKVIEGYRNTKREKVSGLGGNLKYFKTAFVDYDEPTDRNKIKLTKQATEMLCVREGTFEKVVYNEKFKIFKNSDHYTGIIWDQSAIPAFKKAIKNSKGKFSVYVFSLGDETFDDEFKDIKQKAQLSPIPEAILRVYRRIFK